MSSKRRLLSDAPLDCIVFVFATPTELLPTFSLVIWLLSSGIFRIS